MGGFRFNGFGATDHFKKLKNLGIFTCPNCQRTADFYLTDAKFKIDILFIPTVTLKSRYAVICGKCQTGEFCSGQWANKLMTAAAPVTEIFESQAQTSAPPQMPGNAASSGLACSGCGALIRDGSKFCMECGAKL